LVGPRGGPFRWRVARKHGGNLGSGKRAIQVEVHGKGSEYVALGIPAGLTDHREVVGTFDKRDLDGEICAVERCATQTVWWKARQKSETVPNAAECSAPELALPEILTGLVPPGRVSQIIRCIEHDAGHENRIRRLGKADGQDAQRRE
jgi:hypothetical protein